MAKRPNQVGQMQPLLEAQRYSVNDAKGMARALSCASTYLSHNNDNAVCFALDSTLHAYAGQAKALIGLLLAREEGTSRMYAVVDDWLRRETPIEFLNFEQTTPFRQYEMCMEGYRHAWIRYMIRELRMYAKGKKNDS